MSNSKKRILWAGVIALVIIALDQLSKQWALSALADGRRVSVLGDFFGFELFFNSGAAFSLGTESTIIFTIIAAVVVIAIPFVIKKIASMSWAICLGLIWGGAAGNLIDRLVRAPGAFRGHVVDFMAYSDWFIGNVADAALVIGVLLLIVVSFRSVPDPQENADAG